jgi:cysteine-rich repeat protein
MCNTMRTSILCAAFLGLFAAGCAGDLSGTGGGDDQQSATCGNGSVETDETCDDGNTANGDGCSSTCTTEASATPKLNVTVDKMTVNTELAKSEKFTLNLQSQGGFEESVTVAATLVDGAGAPITSMMVTGPTTVAVAKDITTPTEYTVVIPSDATGAALAATLKFDVTSTLGAANITSTINVSPIFTITINAGTGAQNPMHPLAAQTFTVKRGTKLHMLNSDTVEHISHGGNGIPHEPGAIGAGTNGQPNATYIVDTTPIALGTNGTFGCHTHGTASYGTIQIR